MKISVSYSSESVVLKSESRRFIIYPVLIEDVGVLLISRSSTEELTNLTEGALTVFKITDSLFQPMIDTIERLSILYDFKYKSEEIADVANAWSNSYIASHA